MLSSMIRLFKILNQIKIKKKGKLKTKNDLNISEK
jgi:hypothetical protein